MLHFQEECDDLVIKCMIEYLWSLWQWRTKEWEISEQFLNLILQNSKKKKKPIESHARTDPFTLCWAKSNSYEGQVVKSTNQRDGRREKLLQRERVCEWGEKRGDTTWVWEEVNTKATEIRSKLLILCKCFCALKMTATKSRDYFCFCFQAPIESLFNFINVSSTNFWDVIMWQTSILQIHFILWKVWIFFFSLFCLT